MKIKIALATMFILYGCNKPKERVVEKEVQKDHLEEYYHLEEVRYEEQLSKLAG